MNIDIEKDLECPQSIHEKTKHFTFCAENKTNDFSII